MVNVDWTLGNQSQEKQNKKLHSPLPDSELSVEDSLSDSCSRFPEEPCKSKCKSCQTQVASEHLFLLDCFFDGCLPRAVDLVLLGQTRDGRPRSGDNLVRSNENVTLKQISYQIFTRN